MLKHRSIPKHAPFLKPIPTLKLWALTAALACAGGATFVAHGSVPAATAPLDHYLCASRFGPDCRSVAVTLPDGTTAVVGDANAGLHCERTGGWHRRGDHREDEGGTVAVTNELSPPGADGPTPVALVEHDRGWDCTLVTTTAATTARRRGRFRPNDAIAVASFACFPVDYPSSDSARFTSPYAVQVGDRTLGVRLPSVLCAPIDPTFADGGANALVCFDTTVSGWWHRRWWPGPDLCVPSTISGAPTGPPNPTTSPTTTTESSTTTTESSTTTTAPTESSTTTTESTTSTTTTTSSPSTTTTTTTTTTTPPSSTQPCAGHIVDGVCVINL